MLEENPTMSLLPANRFSTFSSHYHHHNNRLRRLLRTPFIRLSISTQTHRPKSKEELPFIAQYLVSTFGISVNRARKLSGYSYLAKIKGPDQPDSVVGFLKDVGLSDAEVKDAVSFKPLVLGYSVDDTLKLRVGELVDAGFARETLVSLIQFNPMILTLKGTVSRLQFWRRFLGENDEALLKAMRKNKLLLQCDVDNHIIPMLNLLKEYGISEKEITALVMYGDRILLHNYESLSRDLRRTEELGFLVGSKKFFPGFRMVMHLSEKSLEKKVAFFKDRYGWSEEEIYSALRKMPSAFTLSVSKLKSKMDFLTGEAGLEPKTIAAQPSLLAISLERILVPRYRVLRILKEKKLKRCGLLTVCVISEKRFLESYVEPYKKHAPELRDVYLAAYKDV